MHTRMPRRFVAGVHNLAPGAHEALSPSEEVVETLGLSLRRAANAGIYANNQLNARELFEPRKHATTP